MNFKKTYKPKNGYTPISKIGECSLKMLEFGMIELDGGDFLEYYTDDKETAFIMLEGHCDVEANGEKWENIGNRSTVFENRKAAPLPTKKSPRPARAPPRRPFGGIPTCGSVCPRAPLTPRRAHGSAATSQSAPCPRCPFG